MQQSDTIIVAAKTKTASRHIIKIFEAANCLNPLWAIEDLASMKRCISEFCPRLVLVDLGMDSAWEILELLRQERDGCAFPVMALVDEQTEGLLDRAYETGVRSYLRGPFTFSEFVERSRLLNLRFRIERPPVQ